MNALLMLLVAAVLAKECSFWISLNDCAALTSCFWMSHDGVCADIHDWAQISNTASTCDVSNDMWECYNHVDCFWVAHKGSCESIRNWGYHVGSSEDPAAKDCGFWSREGDCWLYEQCFWNKRANACQPMVITSPEPSTTTTTTSEPTFNAMNSCERLIHHSSCALNDDCIWSDTGSKCVAVDGDCRSLDSPSLCAHNDVCMWVDTDAVCQSMCEQIGTESRCAYNADCFWMEDTCTPINAACGRLETPSFCTYNERCFWSEIQDSCISFYGPCDTMTSEEFCTMGDHCEWNEITAICDPAPTDTAEPIIIDCEAITDVEICERSNATEHNVPCVWSEIQDKCVEFKFDCEDFMTRDACNAAWYGSMKCHWDGECDELKLKSNEKENYDENKIRVMLFAVLGLLSGVIGSLAAHKCCVYNASEVEDTYVDLSLRSV